MSKATVFIGDLSRFCSDEDISSLFHRFGKVLETKIMRNPVTGISLGYGFLIMSSTESAFLAMQYLHGVQLRGRPLRVKWAGRNIKNDANSQSLPRFPRDSTAETVINSVHVRFQALHISSCLFTEESLYQFFLPFGEVIDASIKESNVDEVTGLQHGYGFVHFNSTTDGAQSAFRAIMELSGDAFFSLHCEGSRNFMKQFHGNGTGTPTAQTPASSPKPGSTPPTVTRAPNPKYRSLQTAQSNIQKKQPSYREYNNFQTGPQYFNQVSSQPIPDTIQAYQSTSFMNTASNAIQNPVYCYGSAVPYCPIPTSDANIIMPSSAFPTQTNMSSYSPYDAYPHNYSYFPIPVHVALHPHLANGTAGPTTKPSYLSYTAGPSPRGHGPVPAGMGAVRGPNSPKDESSSFISHPHRAEEKTQLDKRAHTRTRSSNKARSAQSPRKNEAKGLGLGESHSTSPTVEPPRVLVDAAPTSEVVAPV